MNGPVIAAEWLELLGELDELGHRLWRGPIDRQGYARFHGVRVQRLVWRLADPRPLPPGARLVNVCGLPHCTRLAHWRCRHYGLLLLAPAAV